MSRYLILHENTIKVFLPFLTTYLHETIFSAMSVIKSKQRNRSIISPAITFPFTTLPTRIKKLTIEIEKQQSH